jgi:hypothetical protein
MVISCRVALPNNNTQIATRTAANEASSKYNFAILTIRRVAKIQAIVRAISMAHPVVM